jgi:AAA+ superfamily predicted ATPase
VQKNNTNSDETLLPLLLHVTALPHQSLDGYWEALIYKEPIGDQLLRVLTGAIRKFHNKPEDLLQNAWYNTALFSGPPGSGKTSLAHALAQQLSIRMSDLYSNTKMLQVDASAVFSHMYEGTAKEVGSMFATIRQLASIDSDEAQLVIVLIDEIDKLVPCRKDVSRKNEPLDTMRVGLPLKGG